MATESTTEHKDTKENVHRSGKFSGKYQSNPFLVTVDGLIALLKVNPVPSLLLTIFLMLIITAGFFLSIPLMLIPFIGFFIFMAVFVAIVPLAEGAYHVLALKSLEGEEIKTEECISETFKKLPSLIGASLLIGLIVFGGLLLFIVPGIIFAAWYSMTFFVMFDENLGATESMKRSKELVKGHVLEIISAVIASSILSGTSSGGGGGLLSAPIAIAPLAGWYPQLKELKASGKEQPPVHWMNYVIVIIGGLTIVSIVAFIAFAIALGLLTESSTNNYDNDYRRSNRYEQRSNNSWDSDSYYRNDRSTIETY